VTNKTDFGFDDLIYWAFIQLVTTVHSHLPTGHSTGTIPTSNWTELRCTPSYSFLLLSLFWSESERESENHIATDGQSISKSSCRAPSGLLTRYLLLFDSYGLVIMGRPPWREDESAFLYDAGPRQHSISWVRVPCDWWAYFTVSYLRLLFSSPPTTHRVMVEVFDLAPTRVTVSLFFWLWPLIILRHGPHGEHRFSIVRNAGLLTRYLAIYICWA
jgi:hypothetical protein